MLSFSSNRAGCFTQSFYGFGFIGFFEFGFDRKKHEVINFETSFSNKNVSCTEVLTKPTQYY